MTSTKYAKTKIAAESTPEIHHLIKGKLQTSLLFQILFSMQMFLTKVTFEQAVVVLFKFGWILHIEFLRKSSMTVSILWKQVVVKEKSVIASIPLKSNVKHVQLFNA